MSHSLDSFHNSCSLMTIHQSPSPWKGKNDNHIPCLHIVRWITIKEFKPILFKNEYLVETNFHIPPGIIWNRWDSIPTAGNPFTVSTTSVEMSFWVIKNIKNNCSYMLYFINFIAYILNKFFFEYFTYQENYMLYFGLSPNNSINL